MNEEIHPSTIVITGAASPLGRRVVALARRDPTVGTLREIDDVVGAHDGPRSDLVTGATCVLHLAFAADTEWQPSGTARANVDGTRELLLAMAQADVRQLVVLSSTMVYGAWPNNPIPLTEDAVLRPNPDFAYAVQRSQVEQLVADWVNGDPRRSAATLRPAVFMSKDYTGGWIARSLTASAGARLREEDPPAQFLHVDDLAAAIDLARVRCLDGPFNVAPDNWIPGETVRALAGSTHRLRLPAAIATRVALWRWEFQRGPIPAGLLPYTVHPWVVSNDRLRAVGWAPKRTNEQAYVAGTEAKWWTLLSPKRKQELALGGSILLGLVVLLGGLGLARSVARRSRTR